MRHIRNLSCMCMVEKVRFDVCCVLTFVAFSPSVRLLSKFSVLTFRNAYSSTEMRVQPACCTWLVAACLLHLACCSLLVALGLLQPACCSRPVAVGLLHLACCAWLVAAYLFLLACCSLLVANKDQSCVNEHKRKNKHIDRAQNIKHKHKHKHQALTYT
jgi:hypothetical protein